MPELPEVETTKRGIEPHILLSQISKVNVYDNRLRWPVSADLAACCEGQQVTAVARRAKYILLHLQTHCLLIHLGMSGSMRIAGSDAVRQKHDHIEWLFSNNCRLLFNDPRRFGCVLVSQQDDIYQHKLLSKLGPEPLDNSFDGTYLYYRSKGAQMSTDTQNPAGIDSIPGTGRRKGKSAPVKTFIMDQKIVVGIGNIYANEALFRSGISPLRKAGNISEQRYQTLTSALKQILTAAIDMGGTTLRDFVGGDGKPGYFQQTLSVYGRGGQPCPICGNTLTEIRISHRSTVYCPVCQK